MELTAFSDRGIGTRERLEDYAANDIITTKSGLRLQIAMVCDGAGGGEAGEQAARLTSRTIFEYTQVSEESSVPKLLIKAVEEANKVVYAELQGTGTSTVALAAVHLNDDSTYGRLYIANVGNSRIYLIREGRLARLNIDHTLANEYVFAGQMSPEEAKELNDPNYVTRSIGTGAKVSVDIGFYAERGRDFVNSRRAARIGQKGLELQEGDTIFAASDGLFPFVQDNEFIEYALDDDVERATRTLLKYAADRRPDDNTALSMLFVPSRNRKMVQVTAPRFSPRQRAGIGFFILAIALALAFMAVQVANGENQRVAILATQTFVQQIIIQASYTATHTPLPPTATPTEAIVTGQVGNRYTKTQSFPVLNQQFIDSLSDINYVSLAGVAALSSKRSINPANLYLQGNTTLRLNQVNDTPGSEHVDLVLGHTGDLFANLGDYQHGGISVALEQNPDIVIQSQSSCLSVKQIKPPTPADNAKVAVICYGDGAGSCSLHIPGAQNPVSLPAGQQTIFDITSQKVDSTVPISQTDLDTYQQTIWLLTGNQSQLSCISSWLDGDQDSISYPTDLCPTQTSRGTRDGCWVDGDADSDGLAGSQDYCPFAIGPASNNGCPTDGPVATQYAQTAIAAQATIPPTWTPTMTITPSPTPIPLPDAVQDNYSVEGGKTLTIAAPGVLSNDLINGAKLAATSGKTEHDGTYSLSSDGGFTYTPASKYIGQDTFSYTLTNDLGSDTTTVTINVLQPPIQPPTAAFTATPDSGPEPLTVALNASISTGSINTYTWDFGDTSAGSGKTVTHEYTKEGTYVVTLTVEGPGGSDTTTHIVTVKPPLPVACFTTNPANGTITVGGTVNFNAGCSQQATTYSWNFNDGTTIIGQTVTTANHSFNQIGTFVVTLTVDGPGGQDQVTATITVTGLPPVACLDIPNWDVPVGTTITFTTGCTTNATNATYSWAFSDGGPNPGNVTQVSHIYNTVGNNFTVTVTVTVNGVSSSATGHVNVFNQPVACFDYLPKAIDPNAVVTFDATCTNAPNGTVYDWNYGDNTTPHGTGVSPTHSYAAGGSYVVTLIVTEPNRAPVQTTRTLTVSAKPVANDDLTYAVDMGGTLVVNTPATGVLGNDTVAGSTITSTTPDPAIPAANGSFNKANGTFNFVPNAGFMGPYNFSYTLTNAAGLTDAANVRICVYPIPVNDVYFTTPGTPLNVPAATGLLANDTLGAGAVTITNTALVPGGGGVTLTVNPADGSFAFDPGTATRTTVTFTYKLTLPPDCAAPPKTGTVSITIEDRPIAYPDTYSMAVNGTLTITAPGLLTNDISPSGAALSISAAAVAPAAPLTMTPVCAGGNGTLTMNASRDGGFVYTPPANCAGTVTFKYRAFDGTNSSAQAGALVTIEVGGNLPPVAANDYFFMGVQPSITIAPPGLLGNDSDPDNNPLTATNVSALTLTPPNGGANGTLAMDANGDGGFTYTAPVGYIGVVTFTYTANDGTVDSLAPATVTIFAGVPIARDDPNYVTAFGTMLPVGNSVLVNDTPNTAIPILLSFPSQGILNFNADGTFSYLPNPGFVGTDTFQYIITDGFQYSNVATVTITVNPPGVNTAPIASDDPAVPNDPTYTTPVDTPLIIPAPGVLANDTGGIGPLIALLVSSPVNGTVVLNFDGSFTYTPNTGFTGFDTFAYVANDGLNNSNIATVVVNVGGVAGNTPPVANPDFYNLLISKTVTTLMVLAPDGVLANDTDANNDPLVVNLATVGALNLNPVSPAGTGTLTMNPNGDGGFTYTPPTGYTGTVTFTYNANDGVANSTPATVTITVGKLFRPAAVQIPAPPPATLCTNTNFENPGEIRSHFLNDIDRDQLFCRLIASNGSYMYWFGSPITNAGNVGAQNVLDLGLVAAVDVFSMKDATGFVDDVDICLKGTGYIIYMNANGAPRVPILQTGWTTEAFPGYTCATLHSPGTVILVSTKPH